MASPPMQSHRLAAGPRQLSFKIQRLFANLLNHVVFEISNVKWLLEYLYVVFTRPLSNICYYSVNLNGGENYVYQEKC